MTDELKDVTREQLLDDAQRLEDLAAFKQVWRISDGLPYLRAAAILRGLVGLYDDAPKGNGWTLCHGDLDVVASASAEFPTPWAALGALAALPSSGNSP